MLKQKEDIIKDIGTAFGDNDYIYLPKLNIGDIIYCFKYGKDIYLSGRLNPTDFTNINVNDFLYKEEYLNNLRNEFSKEINNKEELKKIEDNISRINNLYEKLEQIKYNFKYVWL